MGELLEYLRKHGRQQQLKSGWVEKQPIDHRTFNRRWRPKWLELHPHAVVWFNEPNSIPRGYLLLAPTATVQEHKEGKGAVIEVTSSSGRKLRVRLNTLSDHGDWHEAISGALRKQREALATEANRRGSLALTDKKKGLAAAGGEPSGPLASLRGTFSNPLASCSSLSNPLASCASISASFSNPLASFSKSDSGDRVGAAAAAAQRFSRSEGSPGGSSCGSGSCGAKVDNSQVDKLWDDWDADFEPRSVGGGGGACGGGGSSGGGAGGASSRRRSSEDEESSRTSCEQPEHLQHWRSVRHESSASMSAFPPPPSPRQPSASISNVRRARLQQTRPPPPPPLPPPCPPKG